MFDLLASKIYSLLRCPFNPPDALVGTIKTPSLPLSRRVEARRSRSFEARMFPRNFGRAVGRITTSHYHDDALADALAEARRCVGKARACTEALAAAAK